MYYEFNREYMFLTIISKRSIIKYRQLLNITGIFVKK